MPRKTINHQERAKMAWPHIVEAAKLRKTVTYGELAGLLSLHHRAMRYLLGEILFYCETENIPPLTSIVVAKGSGLPGGGYYSYQYSSLDRAQVAVFEFDWDHTENPFTFAEGDVNFNLLAAQLAENPSGSEQVISKVPSRGMAQLLFKKALLISYDHRCAFCGSVLEAQLEACHIVPWSEATLAERIDPRNGLLLCSSHHKLFDSGWMSVSENFEIDVWEEGEKADCKSDKVNYYGLSGKKIRLPENKKARPRRSFLRKRLERDGWI